jgi:hypothetical protein
MNLILSPILNGKKKNRITPDVILLKIDHCANIATPTTVVTDEMAIIISLGWTPNNDERLILIIYYQQMEVFNN